ncbi:PP2C family protein-serine/threonine phosphatase [Streptomyces sp. NPDC059944]|uniref:PP2C family protein-serine/threonine phosphatase n=1 Tax=unclassified Streptomyces TaxID=2593676 RepID=UPI00363B257C
MRDAAAATAMLELMQASHTVTLEQLPDMVTRFAATAGMYETAIFVVDIRETVLRQLTGKGLAAGGGGGEFPVQGSLPGRAFQTVQLLSEQDANADSSRHQWRWWIPITDGVERLGVLRTDTDLPDAFMRQAIRDFASLMALLLLSKRAFSDSYARIVRTEPMNVAAEMQWHLTPPHAYAGQDTTVGAINEPAYQIGGDAFDYAVAGDTLHLGIFDAMGHDTKSGVTANIAVSTCRNARRQGSPLIETSQRIEAALIDQFGTSRYVTAILADLDMSRGILTWINRGHHLPILLRDNKWTTELTCPPADPMGCDLGLPIAERSEQLEPGDRLILYTDGIIEARDSRGSEFGRDRFTDYIRRHHSGQHTLHETLRRLVEAVLQHHDGRLNDDATVLLTEWRGGYQDYLTP